MSADDVRIRVHEMYMQRAIELARRGWYTAKPNPRVGCVIVAGTRIIGDGWHARAGEPHAERNALSDAKARGFEVEGATAYVTLEPCAHTGRTPPCTQALIEAGIERVVVGAQDPNPSVDGQGIDALRAAGIDVITGVLGERCAALNAGFNQRMTSYRPRVRVKLAMSLDGRTAAADGTSQWITGETAREDVHRLRAESGAVMIGRGTCVADDPSLTVRLPGEWDQPLRVVLDSQLAMARNAKMFSEPGETLVFTASDDEDTTGALEEAGARVARIGGDQAGLDLARVLGVLAEREINDVLVEAGPTLAGALTQAGLVDEYIIYMAPQLIGDTGRGLMSLAGAVGLDDATRLVFDNAEPVGADLKITARPVKDQ